MNRQSGTPAYRQVADDLRAQIADGRLAPGAQLPAEPQLSETYGVARLTIRHAVDQLRNAGLVDVERGRGTFVRARPVLRRMGAARLSRAAREADRSHFRADTAAAGVTSTVAVGIDVVPADDAVAVLLDIEPGTPVLVRDRVMSADDRPVQLAVSHFPAALVEGSPIADADTGPGGSHARLADLGHAPDRFVEVISTRMPSPAEAEALALVPGTPVLRVIRTAYDAGGRPVEVNTMTLAGDSWELVHDFPAS